MTGFLLLKRSVTAVFRNFDDALAISGLLWVALTAVIVFISSFAPEITLAQDAPVSTGSLLWLIVPNLAALIVGIWVAVEWHRFALLGVRPTTIFPQLHMAQTLSYLGHSLKLIVLMVVIAFAIVFVATIIGTFSGVLQPLLAVVPAITLVGAFLIFYRLSPILPAAAIGQSMTLKQAWQRTQSIQKEIYQAVFLLVLATLCAQLPMLVLPGELIALLYSLIVGWIGLMVGVSLLSAIYEMSEGQQGQP
ncbi:hypothetical protein EDD53_2463 [Pacificibacter maritimus]|uniref:Glycerophosphoryl diester phosphodiesterase membrane domain-containing protein n=1 Tax=Pacificibacter maritimus TaxID=762213 RepID=A0A3N4U1K9_9RHOB|nr:hypothetical protein [Pacificibacter maritimus]RPE64703.1 hypothetical protein EDD53_2463 [Pacificibacter maritimus]